MTVPFGAVDADARRRDVGCGSPTRATCRRSCGRSSDELLVAAEADRDAHVRVDGVARRDGLAAVVVRAARVVGAGGGADLVRVGLREADAGVADAAAGGVRAARAAEVLDDSRTGGAWGCRRCRGCRTSSGRPLAPLSDRDSASVCTSCAGGGGPWSRPRCRRPMKSSIEPASTTSENDVVVMTSMFLPCLFGFAAAPGRACTCCSPRRTRSGTCPAAMSAVTHVAVVDVALVGLLPVREREAVERPRVPEVDDHVARSSASRARRSRAPCRRRRCRDRCRCRGGRRRCGPRPSTDLPSASSVLA